MKINVLRTLRSGELNVPHIAKLANLKLKNSEIKKFESQLSEILSYIEKLKEADTKSVGETSQVTGLENVTRKDVIDSSRTLTQEEALSNAKSKYNGFFKVKGIFDED